MRHILKTFVSTSLVILLFISASFTVTAASNLNGSDTNYIYNGVIIASATYTCDSETSGSKSLWWTVFDRDKNKRDWPSTIVIKGNTIYDTHETGTKLCTLSVGNTYDIRVVFVHSETGAPYYYLMIEGAGVTSISLSGSYKDGVWVSAKRNSNASKITSSDGISVLQDGFSLDYVCVTDGYDNRDKYYANSSDFQNLSYSDGALQLDMLWKPDSESVTSENVKVSDGEKEINIDKLVCNENKILIFSRELVRGKTYSILLKDTTKTSLGNEVRVPLKTKFTLPFNRADILSGVLSDGSFALKVQNLTDNEFKFTLLIALKDNDGSLQEVIVSDNYSVPDNTTEKEIIVENLDFKSYTPEVFVVKSASLPVPVSDRVFSK